MRWWLLVALAGCTGPLVPVAPEPPAAYTTTGVGRGTGCGLAFLGLVPIGLGDRPRRAYDEALRAAGGSGLTDVQVTEHWYFVGIGNVYCTDVEGVGFTVR